MCLVPSSSLPSEGWGPQGRPWPLGGDPLSPDGPCSCHHPSSSPRALLTGTCVFLKRLLVDSVTGCLACSSPKPYPPVSSDPTLHAWSAHLAPTCCLGQSPLRPRVHFSPWRNASSPPDIVSTYVTRLGGNVLSPSSTPHPRRAQHVPGQWPRGLPGLKLPPDCALRP